MLRCHTPSCGRLLVVVRLVVVSMLVGIPGVGMGGVVDGGLGRLGPRRGGRWRTLWLRLGLPRLGLRLRL